MTSIRHGGRLRLGAVDVRTVRRALAEQAMLLIPSHLTRVFTSLRAGPSDTLTASPDSGALPTSPFHGSLLGRPIPAADKEGFGSTPYALPSDDAVRAGAAPAAGTGGGLLPPPPLSAAARTTPPAAMYPAIGESTGIN